MTWFDIIKYNREHYVAAGKKHNDEKVIESHKQILDIVNRSDIKNKKMGRKIGAIKSGLPIITGEEYLNKPFDENTFFVETNRFLQYLDRKVKTDFGDGYNRGRESIRKISRKLVKFSDHIYEQLEQQKNGYELEEYIKRAYRTGARAILRLVREYNKQVMSGRFK
jgi:hypothetical protein